MIQRKDEVHDRTQSFFKTPRTRPKGLHHVSVRRAKENKLYEAAKKRWREFRESFDGFKCEVVQDGQKCQSRAGKHPHHKKGRAGSLLWDQQFFLAVCNRHHRFIHDNPAWSYDQGYMIKRL